MERVSDQYLRLFIDQAPVSIAMFDRGMRYLAVSDYWLRQHWISDRHIIGRSHYDVVPEIPERWKVVHQRGLAGEFIREDEDAFERGDGSIQYLRWEVRPWRTPDGVIGGIIITTEDVTARVVAERALEQSQADLKRAQGIGRIGSWKVNLRTGELIVSEETYQLLRLSRGMQLDYSNVLSIIHPEDAGRVDATWKACLKGKSYDIEYRVLVGQTARWVHDRAEVDFGEDGTPLKAFGTLQDITDRKQAEIALSQSEQRLRLALDAADMGIWEWNVSAGTYEWNDQTYRMLGYEPQSFVPDYDAWARRVHPDDLPKLAAEAQQMMENPREAIAEYRAFGPSNELRWLEARGRFECDGEGRPKRYYGVLMDVTERKRAEERDRILTAEVNHRAKNLLAVVQAVALQTARADDPNEFAQNFNNRLAGLAASQDLLVQSHWQGVSVEELVRSQLSHFAGLIGQRILLNGGPAQLEASAAQALGMAIHELATNASKYGALSSASGIIQVSWEIEERDEQSRFSMQWVEANGPTIKEPERRGFGHSILVDMAEYSLSATVNLTYPASGLRVAALCPGDGSPCDS